MNTFFRILTLALVATLILSTTANASIRYNLDEFISKGNTGKFSIVQAEDESFFKTSISPDLELGPVSVGVDFNVYMPINGGNTYPSDLEFLTLRHVGYDHERKHGFKWGHLSNLTFGQGLLMDNFDTAVGGSIEFNSKKAGFLGYSTIEEFRIKTLWTGNNVKAGRVQYRVGTTPIFDSPLLIGATYVTDTDGVDYTLQGNRIYRDKQSGWSADVALPLAGEFLTAFSEYAQLVDQGRGAAAGFRGSFFQLGYRAEYRSLGERFVPSYFNSSYEATSFSFPIQAPKEQLNGFLVAANAGFMDGMFKAGLEYEDYGDGQNVLTAAVGWKKFQNTVGVINYNVPFQGSQNATSQADILYITGGWMDYIFHIKRTYLTSSTFIESYSVGARVNLDKFFPNLGIGF